MNQSHKAPSTFGNSLPTTLAKPMVEQVTLGKGLSLTIRLLRPEDTPFLAAFLSRLSPETVYFRFLSQWKGVLQEEMTHLSAGDDTTQLALVAVREQGSREKVVALASYDVNLQIPEVAEAAFVVENGWQGKGLGTLLIERLVACAYGHGVRIFQYIIHSNNLPMFRLLRHSGTVIKKKQECGVCEVWVRLEPKEEHIQWMCAEGVPDDRETATDSAH